MFGTFEIVQIPSINKVAGIKATAAFFAPLIITSPFRCVPPFITNLPRKLPPKVFYIVGIFSRWEESSVLDKYANLIFST